jgi:uridine phosphorylase
MSQFSETEMILTADKRLYHINLKNEDIADIVLLVGDQNRVSEISKYFSSIDFKTAHREFITHTGTFNNKRITVLSTGIGTDNIDIVLNELDAAANIDPEKRELNKTLRQLNIFRLGTSGSLQTDILVDSLVCSSHGLGLDGLLNYYDDWNRINEELICEAFIKHTNWNRNLPYPYCISADQELLEKFKTHNVRVGITVTAPGFYGPQGRQLRLKPAMSDLNENLTTFNFRKNRITNFEMETSALYGLGKLLGHRCLTVCVIIANRVRKEFTKDYTKSVDHLIETCLNIITK